MQRTLLAIIAAVFLVACSPRNLYPEARADKEAIVRQWARPTHGMFEAGDRGFEYSHPVFHQNTLIFGNQSFGLVSLYPISNQVRWALPISNGIVSPIRVVDATVYFGGGDGYVYSVDAETGQVNWRYEVRNPIISKPALSNNRLLVTTSNDMVYAFDAGTGEWLWHYKRRSSPSATILGASEPAVSGDIVYAGLSDGFLVALSLQDGSLKWEQKLHRGRRFTDVDAHPVIDSGKIYIASYDGALYCLTLKGEIRWRFDAGGSKSITIEGDRLYLPSSDGHVYTLNKKTGEPIWKFELDSGIPTTTVPSDRLLIFGSTARYFYAIDKSTGKVLYRFDAGWGSGFSGSPAYDPRKGRIYALSGAGNLYSFQIRQKRTKRTPWLGGAKAYEFFGKSNGKL